MERKVTIISSRTQSQHVLNSNATTLGELKEEARRAGIDFEDMSWFEGHLRAELLEDNSPLPTDIPWRGTTTNDLTFMLSNSEKHIKSGNLTRTELYNKIKELELAGRCSELYGRNYTQCTNEQLRELITSCGIPQSKCTEKDTVLEGDINSVREAVRELIEELYHRSTISSRCYDNTLGLLSGKSSKTDSDELSQNEIDEMFDFIK